VIHAVIAIQPGERNGARAFGAFEIDRRAVDQHGRGHIPRKRRETALTAGRHVAHIALVLQAEIIAFPPPLGLIVKQTPRVEAQIAADGAVLPVGRPGHGRRRLGNCRKIAADAVMGGDIGQFDPGADA